MITYLKNEKGFRPIEDWIPYCWISVECPTEDEVALLSARYNIPVEFITDIADTDERPRSEVDDDYQYLIIRIPHFFDNGAPYITVPFGIIFSNEVILTLCYYQTQMLADFTIYTQRKNINVANNFDFVMRLILSSSIWFLKYLKQINNQIRQAEIELERSIKNKELQSLMSIEKSLVYFITSLRGNGILFSKTKNLKFSKEFFDEDLYEDAEIELKQAIETANIYSDILSGIRDSYASVISNNLNVIIKQLTSISIILMIPTVIASIFGMNIPNFLENNNFAFMWVILGSFLISIVSVMLFKRRDWF